MSEIDDRVGAGVKARSRDRLAGHDGLVAILLFVAALAIYLSFQTAHHSYDAVAGGVLLYQWITSGSVERLFHEYHILYLPFAAIVDRALATLGIAPDPLTLLQVINALFAAGAVALFYRLARLLGPDPVWALILTGLFGLGYSFWYYATDGEPYAPSVLFLLAAFLAALRAPPDASVLRLARPGVWLGLATGMHITCILALPALAIVQWRDRRSAARRLLVLLATTGVVAAAPYVATYALFQGKDLVSGLTGDLAASIEPHYSMPQWWSLDLRNLPRQWSRLVQAWAPLSWVHAASSFPALARALGLALTTLTILPWLLLAARRRWPARATVALAVWFATTFLFFSTYNVGSEKFATYQWAPMLLLTGVAVSAWDLRPAAKITVRAVGAVLVAVTLVCSADIARQQTDGTSNPHLVRALAIARHTEPGDLIVHLGRGETEYQKVYTPYFAMRPSVILDFHFDKTRRSAARTLESLSERFATHATGGGRVVVLSDALEAGEPLREFERLHDLDPGTLGEFFAALGPSLLVEDPALGRLWLLRGPRLAANNGETAPATPSP